MGAIALGAMSLLHLEEDREHWWCIGYANALITFRGFPYLDQTGREIYYVVS